MKRKYSIISVIILGAILISFLPSLDLKPILDGLYVGRTYKKIIDANELKTLDGIDTTKTITERLAEKLDVALGDTAAYFTATQTKAQIQTRIDSLSALKENVKIGIKFIAPVGSFNGIGILTSTSYNNDFANADVVRGVLFYLPFKMTVDSIGCYITTGAAGGTSNHGIYSAAKVKLIDSGALDCATTGYKKAAITPVTLEAGFYYSAWSISNTAIRGMGWSNGGRNGLENDTQIHGVSPNPTVGGVMPSSLGTLTKSTINGMNTILIDK